MTQSISNITRVWNYFIDKGYLHSYSLIFSLPQFPLFFLTQVIWSIYVVFQSKKKPATTKSKIIGFIQSFLMIFLPKEVAALYLHRKSALFSNLKQFPIFVAIFIIINYSPDNLIPQFLNYFQYIFGFLQGLNHVRFFNLIFRNTDTNNVFFKFLVSTTFANFDILIEIAFRMVLKTTKTNNSNLLVLVVSIIYYAIFTILTSYLDYSIYIPYIFLSILIGSLYGAPMFMKPN